MVTVQKVPFLYIYWYLPTYIIFHYISNIIFFGCSVLVKFYEFIISINQILNETDFIRTNCFFSCYAKGNCFIIKKSFFNDHTASMECFVNIHQANTQSLSAQ